MAKDFYSDKEFIENITEPFYRIADAINRLSGVLDNSFTSYKFGQALDGVSYMPGTLDRLVDALEVIADHESEE